MKYSQQQIEKLKEKGIQRFHPKIPIKDGFFIIESKMNEI